MKCVFCEIIGGNLPAEVIFENESVLSFLDINPMNFGHTLVIPKKHFEDFTDIPDEVLTEVISAVRIVSSAVKTGLNTDGYNLVANNGSAAGQSVFHFHFHVIPRFNSDFKMKLNLKRYPENSIQEYAQLIKKEISK